VLRARFATLVREAAKVIKAGKEGADRVTHVGESGGRRPPCQGLPGPSTAKHKVAKATDKDAEDGVGNCLSRGVMRRAGRHRQQPTATA